jgi:hypothetical protein
MQNHLVEDSATVADKLGRSLTRHRLFESLHSRARRALLSVFAAISARLRDRETKSRSAGSVRSLGELAVEADLACACGDAAILEGVFRVLAERVAEPLHCELAALADFCRSDLRSVIAQWPALRERLY